MTPDSSCGSTCMAKQQSLLRDSIACAAETSQENLLGFNGELCESLTGHYLLGNGYRAFNPVLMRFNSPDSLSPFGEGGINAYAYCKGDPVNSFDSDGHRMRRPSLPLGLSPHTAPTLLPQALRALDLPTPPPLPPLTGPPPPRPPRRVPAFQQPGMQEPPPPLPPRRQPTPDPLRLLQPDPEPSLPNAPTATSANQSVRRGY